MTETRNCTHPGGCFCDVVGDSRGNCQWQTRKTTLLRRLWSRLMKRIDREAETADPSDTVI